jgi:uncharacterized RDD family membrane protein YckC
MESNYSSQKHVYPGLPERIKALVIDVGVLLIVFLLAFNIIDFIGGAPGYIRGAILLFMFFLYDPLMVGFFGFTIGHYFMKLRVRDNGNPSKKLLLPLAFLRSFIKGSIGWMSFLTIGFNDRRRAFHDMASGAVVIEIE